MWKFLFATSIIIITSSCNDTPANNKLKTTDSPSVSQPINFTCHYSEYKTNSKKLYKQYLNGPGPANKQILLANIRDSLFTCWLGTPWDFYGTTEDPRNGKIACGYFVTTLLRDMGVAVNRTRDAQCPSEEMIKNVCLKNTIHRSSDESMSSFNDKIKKNGAGLYVVGLDYHTGFILNDGEEIYFIHANYAGNKAVEKEIAIQSSVLFSSRYKVIGKVF